MIKILKFPILITLILYSPLFYAEGNHKIFNLGDFDLESGITLPNAKLSYVTHGKLNKEKDNLIVVPSAYLGDHHGFDFLIEPGKALDPEKYFLKQPVSRRRLSLTNVSFLFCYFSKNKFY